MIGFLLRRLRSALLILVLASIVTFGLIYLAPGDPATIILARRIGHLPSRAEAALLGAQYGLDQPPLAQYLAWAGQVVRGDLGRSIRTGAPVVEELRARLGATWLLAGATTLFTVLLGIPVGFAAALRPHSLWARLARLGALLSVSLPSFWLAFLLVLLFAIRLRWLPTFGFTGPASVVLPVVSLGLANAAYLSRLTRSVLLDVRHQDYMRTARAKGLAARVIWLRHGFPNIAVPLVTLVANQFGHIAAGAVIIETIFAWPGIGPYYVAAVGYRDIPVIQAMVLVFAALFVAINLVSDIAYRLIDPRLRTEG